MIKSKLNLLFSHLFFLVLFPSISSATYTHLLWEREISNALNDREEYYQKVGITHDQTTFNMLWTQKGSMALNEQLELNIDSTSPWYHFLSGIVNSRSSVEKAAFNFKSALDCAQDRPGITWVLFFEFRQAKQERWAEKCLKQLEKYFFKIGAQSSTVLSQQLLTIANQERRNGNIEAADKYVGWSSRFERYPFWQTFTQAVGYLPRQPGLFIATCTELINMVKGSWLLQLTLLSYSYIWFRYAIIAFIIITFIIASLETLPIALHPITDILPLSVSARLRYLLCVAMFLSLLVFGIIPFLLITAILLWQHIENPKRLFFAASVLLLILSPVDARIQEMFRVSLSPDRSLGLFRRVISEGWHFDLENRVLANLRQNNTDHLSHISAAILDLKKDNIETSISHIQNAEELNANDPITLITAGNIFNSAGNEKKAEQYYNTCIEKFPDYEMAIFNLGQLNMFLVNATEGTEQITKAAELNPKLVNNFIKKNALYFSDTWPKLRRFMQPDYEADYFWKQVFPQYCGSWKSAKKIWGSTFFGVPPLWFLSVTLILFILVLTIKITPTSKNMFFCKLCGHPMCKKCRIGPLCNDCVQATDTHHSEMNQHAKFNIKKQEQLLFLFTKNILNLFFPGVDGLYKKKSISIVHVVLLIVTSFICASYIALLTFDFLYPFWVVKNCFTTILFCLLTYHLLFGIRTVRILTKEFRAIGGSNGT